MLLQIFSIIAPVFAIASVGFLWARTGRPYDIQFVTRLIMNVGAPCLVISSFQKVTIERAALAEVGLAAASVTVGVALLTVIALRLLRAEVRTYFNSLVFQNTGNMGLPLCLFAFGQEGLSLALIFFMWVSTTHFTVGMAVVSGERNIATVLRTPLILGTAIALVLVLTGWRFPVWIANTIDLLAGLTIPLMLITLGVSICTLKVKTFWRSVMFAVMRCGFGFGVGLLVVQLFGLTGVARGVVILQSSMPAAVFNYLLSSRYGRNPDDVAGIVVMSTLLSFAVLPAVLWFLLR